MDFRGDPAAALLELLDPEQNHGFLDHYIDVPFDLSRVFFITTANSLDTIPGPLRDRLEIIEMSSYSRAEKIQIAKQHLIPKLLEDHGLDRERVTLPDETLESVIDSYTREAGVRNLTRELAHLLRSAAEDFAKDEPETHTNLNRERVDTVLGPPRFHTEMIEEHRKPGIATGLAWTPVGGEILHIEVSKMEGKGNLILTGQLGDVMKESAQIALSLLRARLSRGLPFRFDKTDFHVHVPAGAIPKDGPSAGTAVFLALSSLVDNKPLSPRLAVTGEITLRGAVLPVGGIKEKVLAAHRAGIEIVCIPQRNETDLRDVSPDVCSRLQFHFVKEVQDLLTIAGLGGMTTSSQPDLESGTQAEFAILSN
jgi:ATP-dependent Lon protease